MSPRVPGTPERIRLIMAAVARTPGMTTALLARRLNYTYCSTERVLRKLTTQGLITRQVITDPENINFGRHGYYCAPLP